VVSLQKDQHKQWQEAVETARNYTKLYTALDQELMEGRSSFILLVLMIQPKLK